MVLSGATADIMPGNALPIESIPVGTLIHNIEIKAGRGGQMVRSAGQLRPADGQGKRLRAGAPALG